MRSHYAEGGFHFFRRPFPPVCQPLLRSLWDHGMKHLAACGSPKVTVGALQAQGLKRNPTESFPRPAGPVQCSARWHFLNWVLPVEMEMFIHFWKAVSLHWTPPHQTCHKLKKILVEKLNSWVCLGTPQRSGQASFCSVVRSTVNQRNQAVCPTSKICYSLS